MKYLEPDQLPSDTIEKMYGKLVVLMNHLADELRPVVDRQSRHLPVVATSPVMTGSVPRSASSDADGASQSDSDVTSDVYEADSDPMLLMDLAMCGDMSYYVELLEQSAEFFSVRHICRLVRVQAQEKADRSICVIAVADPDASVVSKTSALKRSPRLPQCTTSIADTRSSPR